MATHHYTGTPGLRGNIGEPVDPARWTPDTPEHADMMARRIPLGRPGKWIPSE